MSISKISVRKLGESIMLQCIADLWDENERQGSIDFFRGEGFTTCADVAGMDLYDQGRLLHLVKKIVGRQGGDSAGFRGGLKASLSRHA